MQNKKEGQRRNPKNIGITLNETEAAWLGYSFGPIRYNGNLGFPVRILVLDNNGNRVHQMEDYLVDLFNEQYMKNE